MSNKWLSETTNVILATLGGFKFINVCLDESVTDSIRLQSCCDVVYFFLIFNMNNLVHL